MNKKEIYAGHNNLADMIKGHIGNWREALNHQKIDQHDTSYLDHELAALDAIEKAVEVDEICFFVLNGQPSTPDIEEDFGRLLVKVRTALDFVVNGPVAGMEIPQEEIDKRFDDLVIKLIPEIDVMLQSRVMVKHPFWELADLFSKGGMPEGIDGQQRYDHAVDKLRKTAYEIGTVDPKKSAVEVMDCLAYIATYMQVIMNLYGWRWDDVKLKARQQMAKSGV